MPSSEMDQVSQVPPTSSPQSYLDGNSTNWKDPFLRHGQVKVHASPKAPTNDWNGINWKDPFLRHGQVKVHASPKAPTNSNVSATADAGCEIRFYNRNGPGRSGS